MPVRIVVRSIDEYEHLLKKVLLHFPRRCCGQLPLRPEMREEHHQASDMRSLTI